MSTAPPVRLSPVPVVALAILISGLIAVRVVADAGWDPTALVAFGETAPEITQYAEELLGREVVIRPDAGHDGKFFFIQAVDPWLLEPESNIDLVDRPTYRAQRMLYPTLVGLGGLLPASLIPWSMILVNVLAMGLGTWAVARIAVDLGGSPWWGLAFVLNPGFISELQIGGAGILAAAAAFWGVQRLTHDKVLSGVVLLSLAVLSREAMFVVALGAAGYLWWQGKRGKSAVVAAVPALAALTWAIYVRARTGMDTGTIEVTELGIPFQGLFESFDRVSSDLVHMVARVGIVILFILYLIQAWRHKRLLLAWAFVGFIPLGLVFTRIVWASYFDITRAIAPLLTAFFLLYFVAPKSRDGVQIDPG